MCADLRTGEASIYNLTDLQVMDSSGSQSPVQTLTGTPIYMAIDVLMGQSSTPSTDLESLFYTILAVCVGGRHSDRGAGFANAPKVAAKLRRGGMLAPELEELQYAPQDKHAFLETLHNVFFPFATPKKGKAPSRFHCNDVSTEDVQEACRHFMSPSV